METIFYVTGVMAWLFSPLTINNHPMYYITEKNERRSRQHALWLAVALHLALGAVLYLNTSDQPAASQKSNVVSVEKNSPAHAKPKLVNLP